MLAGACTDHMLTASLYSSPEARRRETKNYYSGGSLTHYPSKFQFQNVFGGACVLAGGYVLDSRCKVTCL